MSIIKQIKNARAIGVPQMYIETPDQQVTMRALRLGKALNMLTTDANDEEREAPRLVWNLLEGFVFTQDMPHESGNQAGLQALNNAVAMMTRPPHGAPANTPMPPPDLKQIRFALLALAYCPADTVALFTFLSPDYFWQQPPLLQQLSLLRNTLKAKRVTLILLGPGTTLPEAIANDFTVLHEPRPNRQQLLQKVQKTYTDFQKDNPGVADIDEDTKLRAAMATQGLTLFGAENALAMSLAIDGINFQTLQEQRYQMIERNGLRVWKEKQGLKDIAGLNGAVNMLLPLIMSKKKRAGAVVFIDEITRELQGGNGGDLSGMSDAYISAFLKYMENNKINGAMLNGFPGCGKTELCKVLGNAADVVTMMLNINDAKSRLMGDSEKNLREIFDIIMAVSGGVPFFLASSNNSANLPPEMDARFSMAHIFFDLPNRMTKDQIWTIKLGQYGLALDQERPPDQYWVGRDIKNCCEYAWMADVSIMEAAQFIMPANAPRPITTPNQITPEQLRDSAKGRYLDAATGRPYVGPPVEATPVVSERRILAAKKSLLN